MKLEDLLYRPPTICSGLVQGEPDERGVVTVYVPSIPATLGARVARPVANAGDADIVDYDVGAEVVVLFMDASLDNAVLVGSVHTARRPQPQNPAGRLIQSDGGVVVRRSDQQQARVAPLVREDYLGAVDQMVSGLKSALDVPVAGATAPDLAVSLNAIRIALVGALNAFEAVRASSDDLHKTASLQAD